MVAGRYRMDGAIASGGMGEVWRATDTVLRRTVAVKVLRPHLSADPSFGARFRAEAHTLATLHHPGVVDVYDYGEVRSPRGGTEMAYLVMAYVEGEPLSQRLDKVGRLAPRATMSIVGRVAEALHAAHSAGIVHRDVKPGNVLINPDGRAVLVDFGVAHTSANEGLTGVHDVVGTALYMAPEQAMKHQITPATDVYSLAAVAYHCLAGVPPFTGESAVAVALAHVHGRPADLPADVPPAVRDVVMTGMAKQPSQRFPSAATMAAAARRAATAANPGAANAAMETAIHSRGATPAGSRFAAGSAAVAGGSPAFPTSPEIAPLDFTTPPGTGAGRPRSRSGSRAAVIAATIAIAAGAIAVLVAMTYPRSHGTPPANPPASVSTGTSGSNGSPVRSPSPGQSGGSTRTGGPTSTKTAKPTSRTTAPTATPTPPPTTGLPTPTSPPTTNLPSITTPPVPTG